jgi:hypothetical protein
MNMQVDQANCYIRAIRNPRKRAYAEQYWAWLIDLIVTGNSKEPPEPNNLGTMAKQAVQMRLSEFANPPTTSGR